MCCVQESNGGGGINPVLDNVQKETVFFPCGFPQLSLSLKLVSGLKLAATQHTQTATLRRSFTKKSLLADRFPHGLMKYDWGDTMTNGKQMHKT